jgi:hypothetical protein
VVSVGAPEPARAGAAATAATTATTTATTATATTPGAVPTTPPLERMLLPGGRAPRGSFIWPALAELASREFVAPAAVTIAESGNDAAPGSPLWAALQPLVTVSPSLAAEHEGVAAAAMLAATAAGAPGALSGSPGSAVAAGSAARAPGATSRELVISSGVGRGPSVGAAGARVTAASSGFAADGSERMAVPAERTSGRATPSLTLTGGAPATSAAARLASAAALSAGRTAGASGAGLGGAGAAGAGAAGAGAPGMPVLTGPAARALELAKPFLRVVESAAPSETRTSSTPRFYEQPQPLVSAMPANPAAASMVEAMRTPPAATSGDDRVTLADLTLISLASANEQIAASPAGGAPAPAATPAPASGGGAGAAGGDKPGNQAHEIEELARAAFEELQRLIQVARERSGDSWES